MASLTIRNLDEETKCKLKDAAKRNGRSLESQARYILDSAVNQGSVEYHALNYEPERGESGAVDVDRIPEVKPLSLVERIRRIMAEDGIYLDDSVLPRRDEFTREPGF